MSDYGEIGQRVSRVIEETRKDIDKQIVNVTTFAVPNQLRRPSQMMRHSQNQVVEEMEYDDEEDSCGDENANTTSAAVNLHN